MAYWGEEIPADELEENLVGYLRRWAPYVGRFALLVQQIFLKSAREAGLQADDRYQARFPALELATVSINFFTTMAGTPGTELITTAAASRGE